MINIANIPEEVFTELNSVLMKNIERSEFEKHYLFSTEPNVRAKLFILCYRMLDALHTVLEDGPAREEVLKEMRHCHPRFTDIVHVMRVMDGSSFAAYSYEKKLPDLLNRDDIVNDLIDLFSILTERQNIIKISEIKGFYLEGESGRAYKKIFGDSDDKKQRDKPEE